MFAQNLIMNVYHGNISVDKSAFIPKTLTHLVQKGRIANVFRLITVHLGIIEKKAIVNLSSNIYHQKLGKIINVKLQEEIILLELIIKEETVHCTHHVKIGIIILCL